jgi:FMN-dependent NADH-azoreductase
MKSLLVINSSGRHTRSITRHLTARFVAAWSARNLGAQIFTRDVGTNPPPPVDELWIAAAFAQPAERTSAMNDALALSDALIDEIIWAKAIVLGVPMYNFGIPGQLKTYIDQIVRIGRTFDFNVAAADPYRPLLQPKPVVIIISTGDGALHPGGALAHLNFLEPHLETVLRFIGLTDLRFIRVGYDEFQDERFRQAMADAEIAVDKMIDQLAPASADFTDCPRVRQALGKEFHAEAVNLAQRS